MQQCQMYNKTENVQRHLFSQPVAEKCDSILMWRGREVKVSQAEKYKEMTLYR